MKNTFKIAAILILFFSFISMNLKENDFHVRIEQNGKFIKPVNGVYTLEKSKFNIVFEFSQPMGLLINGSFKKDTYKQASEGKPKSMLPGFQNTGMAEGLLNSDKELFISNDSPNYWFYDDNENNRFNYVEKLKDKIQCKRTILNFYEPDTKNNIKIEDVKKPLYLVFISYTSSQDHKEDVESKREWVKIKWKK